MSGGAARPYPVRDRTGKTFGIRSQRRVEWTMVGGLVADDVHHGRTRSAGIVQVGNPVGQARPAVKQRHGWFLRHFPIAVSASGHHGLCKTEDAAHALNPVQGKDEL